MTDITFKNHDPDVMLELWHVTKRFGGLTAVGDVSFKIKKGEIYALIGPNGAGKTTIFNLITGVYALTEGRVIFNGTVIGQGEDIIKDDMRETEVKPFQKKPYDIMSRGMARTFQNIRLFAHMSVLDNVKVGLHNSIKEGLLPSLTHLFGYRKAEKAADERALELLDFFSMADLAEAQAGSLPYGAQRRLEIVRALATKPGIILLDEPAAGMNPSETAELMNNIRRIRDTFGIAVLLIEHDMSLVMNICEGICVLDHGKMIAKGTPEEIKSNPKVIEAYLGKKKEAKPDEQES